MTRTVLVTALVSGVMLLASSACVTRTRAVSAGTLRSASASLEAGGDAAVVDGSGDEFTLRATDRVTGARTLNGDIALTTNMRVLGDVLALCRPFAAEGCPLRRATAITVVHREISWPHIWVYTALVLLNGIAGVGFACAFGAVGCDDYSGSGRAAIGVLSAMAPLGLVTFSLLDALGR